MKNERQLALQILLKVFGEGGYSNLVLSKMLPIPKDQSQQKKNQFITALVYGVVERDITLEYLISQYSKKPASKLDLEVALILKMGFYQLLYLDSVPDNAAVDESVKLCFFAKKSSAKGFVNGVLRSFVRDGKKLVIRERDDLKSLSIAYSCPLWLVRQWAEEYSYEEAKALVKASIGRPPLMIRVNTQKTSAQELLETLQKEGVQGTPSPYLENCLMLEHTGNLQQLNSFQQGEFYVQDLASQCCAKLAGVKPGDRVFDLCAAPGGKSFTMAQYLQGEGELVSFDLYPHKLQLIEKTAQKLGLNCISVQEQDACIYDPKLGTAQVVLCDVPCAGLGIIRRKPEIKYKSPESFEDLPALQLEILENGARYVQTGGRLVYSTCSVSRRENNQVADEFLRRHPEFEPVMIPKEFENRGLVEGNQITFLPRYMDSDGFFTALFCKK
ncbi:MAG: 16S rRNA (cytosine(967)-C(5))-methyltransferase RsmB [Massiliimalia sp.]|jgi:16S rRNA (cytosine967-C5)-methyltransferase